MKMKYFLLGVTLTFNVYASQPSFPCYYPDNSINSNVPAYRCTQQGGTYGTKHTRDEIIDSLLQKKIEEDKKFCRKVKDCFSYLKN